MARPHDVELARRILFAVSGAIALQVDRAGPLDLLRTPQGTYRRHEQAKRIAPDGPPDLTALILAEAIEGIAVTQHNFHRPPVAIVLEEGRCAEGQVSGAEGVDR
jgi:hypothetical protein